MIHLMLGLVGLRSLVFFSVLFSPERSFILVHTVKHIILVVPNLKYFPISGQHAYTVKLQ